MRRILVLFLCSALFPAAVFGAAGSASKYFKPGDNGGETAVGYSINASGGALAVNSAAARFALDGVLSIEGTFGFATGDGTDFFIVGGKAIYVLKKYPSFNVYGAGGLNIGYEAPDAGGSSVLIGPYVGCGVEYFIALNLSFSAEFGVAAYFGNDYSRFATYGECISNLGIRYYLD
ncbi:MAG: hypothetical protein LBQ47_07930 [Endomicrobium sp.]|jgi:hypothetical protein|nr:hypothetical protein [Endomicrobium sp.]